MTAWFLITIYYGVHYSPPLDSQAECLKIQQEVRKYRDKIIAPTICVELKLK